MKSCGEVGRLGSLDCELPGWNCGSEENFERKVSSFCPISQWVCVMSRWPMSLGDLTTVCVFFCWAGVGPKTKPLLAVGITEKEKGGVNKTKKVTLIIAKQTSLHLCHTKYSGDLKNQPFETQKHSKTRHVEDRILNGHLAIKKSDNYYPV